MVRSWRRCSIDCAILDKGAHGSTLQLAFREEPTFTGLCMLAEVPSITKIIVALDQLNPFSFREAEFI